MMQDIMLDVDLYAGCQNDDEVDAVVEIMAMIMIM